MKVKDKEKVYHTNFLKSAVAVQAGAMSMDNAVDCAAKVDEAEGEEVDFLELGGYVVNRGCYNWTKCYG